MLYVSRYIDEIDKVVVVDTDDGEETIINTNMLDHYCRTLHLDIKGVDSRWAALDMDSCITIYQDPATKTKRQNKLAVMYGVDIVTSQGMITHISWGEVIKPVKVRLSDFGSECADFLVHGNSWVCNKKIVLVLDDKLKIRASSFAVVEHEIWDYPDAVLDLQEISDDELAESLYVQYGCRETLTQFDYIIDKPERMQSIRGKLRWKYAVH